MTDPRVLAEQRDYYEQRAGEYDDWWLRRGRFDLGPAGNARWRAEADEVAAALTGLDLGGDVLEIASGTGTWSRLLRADRLTLVDGSAAMHARNPVAARPDVTVVTADLFNWDTAETFDAVVAGFWLSHVPDDRLDGFLARVAGWLRPGGRLFLADSRRGPSSVALVRTDGALQTRNLADGREFTVVKVFRDPDVLVAALAQAGIDATVSETSTYFQYATGMRG